MTLDELDALANAATPGPWVWSNGILRQRDEGRSVASGYENDGPVIDIEDEDATYIAACDPATIRTIIARYKMMQEALQFIGATEAPAVMEPGLSGPLMALAARVSAARAALAEAAKPLTPEGTTP